MGLTLAERRAVTETTAIRYWRADKRRRVILDELCATTGWHRNHARKALTTALQPKIVTPRSPRPVTYGPEVIAALTACWTVLGMPAGSGWHPCWANCWRCCVISGSWPSMRTPQNCWCRCRRPPSIAAWPVNERNISSRGVQHQAGIAAQKPDPGAHLGRLERRPTRVR